MSKWNCFQKVRSRLKNQVQPQVGMFCSEIQGGSTQLKLEPVQYYSRTVPTRLGLGLFSFIFSFSGKLALQFFYSVCGSYFKFKNDAPANF